MLPFYKFQFDERLVYKWRLLYHERSGLHDIRVWRRHEFLVEDEVCRASDDRNSVIGKLDRPFTAFLVERESPSSMGIIMKGFGEGYFKLLYIDRPWKYPADIQLE